MRTKKNTYVFKLTDIDIQKIHETYIQIPANIKLEIENNDNTTKLSELNSKCNELVSFLDESKRDHSCNVSMIDFISKKNINLLTFIRNVTFNPMILSILIGVLLFIFNINIDDTPVDYIFSVLAACVSPVGLFAIGITLSFYATKVINKLTVSISILKLVISPIILLIIGFIFFDSGLPEKIPGAFFVSVAPCGHTAIVLCSAYNVNPENIIKALFISTFASMGTIFFAIKYLTL